MDTSASSSSRVGVDPAGSKLCRICSSIPASFWSDEFKNIRANLQPLESMRFEAERGCQLCAILLLGPGRWPRPQPGDLEALELRRHYGLYEVLDDPSLLTLRNDTQHWWLIDLESALHFGFSLVPSPWSRLKPVKMGEHVENLALIEMWLENCRDNHTQCSSNVGCFLPTRLLDLEAFSDGEDIRLVEAGELRVSLDGQPSKYVTLSHCWGQPSKRPITTTKTTLSERMTRIPFKTLSQTFQDSVKISLSLKQRFLWIDSLCIVQDDEEDWAREAASMALVYSHSYFTLAALSSMDSTEGCKMVADIQRSYTNRFVDIDFYGRGEDKTKFPDQRLRIFEYAVFDKESLQVEPLNDRAWALQERELSRRVILFSSLGLLWQCTELRATSQRPWENIERFIYDGQRDAMRKFKNNASWNDIVEDYSARSLTKQSDKLVALSGIARAAQEFYPGATYVGGMWSALLPSSLLWKTLPQDPQPELAHRGAAESEYIAPSWSWASVSSRVEFNECYSKSTDDYPTQNLKVEEMVGIPKHQDPYGALEYGALVLSGVLLLEVEIAALYSDMESKQFRDIRRDGVFVGMVNLDAPEIFDLHSKFKLYFLTINTYMDIFGLVIRQEVNPDDGFIRVGRGKIFQLCKHEVSFSDCEPCIIKLI